MTLAATRIASSDETKEQYAVIKIHPVVRVVNLCRAVLNVVNKSMPHASGKLVVPVRMLSAQNHPQWMTVQYAKKEDNVVMANVVSKNGRN